MTNYLNNIDKVRYEGPDSTNPFAYKYYDANQVTLGKTMAEHLRLAVCYWHTFCWNGTDMFGLGSLDRSWQKNAGTLEAAKQKADIAFEFFTKLGVPYYCFHDVDVAPEGNSIKDYIHNFNTITDILERKQAETGVKLLWGTANCFSHPRYMSGASTNPNPEVFAWAATQVYHAMNATKRLGGENYVLWGGREGYETLLNTDLKREREQIGRFMQMVVEHKHNIGFNGTLLIEPKPQEPTKHQYDYDVAMVYGFLKQFGLENEIKVNIEANHAILAGHTFQHEVATAFALDIFGSIDANRGDPQLGWDTDQFPNSVEENTLVMYEILKNGGFTTGGFNFDAKIRRQSTDPYDLFYAHIGAIDVLALSFKRAAQILEEQRLQQIVDARYAGWRQSLGQQILQGNASLAQLAQAVEQQGLDPQPVSGKQEYLENLVNGYIYR
ncbi:Xylose isomerase [Aggregatibacter actinomycetemcomitans]|uniref:xylose isomerase n=1 Tax=Aggregatibacter actinomycetemcomitans TaxID=714 RepID=UPI0001B9F77E|nr:xylose isomerase [Aggregatibacter actinomycetemcomitans]ACX81757.1 xylose isomerase [Aggregatibacter actinomycetemcomitans D11S-1]KOE60226.1 xylose isomerase [Aggregatibacter actinomycetemcomitans serotype c str. SCC2302]KOE60900.1 xylose isomerase [Aggregatibacter actinomycetemcomitans serotype c str. AAS4A]KOE63159.1 xylose isomerase [Aggregatibacter actinomycetemcomitans serotype c str. D17P-2]KYK76809.1 xylose isomerase [Aggregatibacter actinomycetemcomitans serotype e str. SA2149]